MDRIFSAALEQVLPESFPSARFAISRVAVFEHFLDLQKSHARKKSLKYAIVGTQTTLKRGAAGANVDRCKAASCPAVAMLSALSLLFVRYGASVHYAYVCTLLRKLGLISIDGLT